MRDAAESRRRRRGTPPDLAAIVEGRHRRAHIHGGNSIWISTAPLSSAVSSSPRAVDLGFGVAASSASEPRPLQSSTASWRRLAAAARRRILMVRRPAPPPPLPLLAESWRRPPVDLEAEEDDLEAEEDDSTGRHEGVMRRRRARSFPSPCGKSTAAGCAWGCGGIAGVHFLLQRLFLLFPFFIADADAEYCWRHTPTKIFITSTPFKLASRSTNASSSRRSTATHRSTAASSSPPYCSSSQLPSH